MKKMLIFPLILAICTSLAIPVMAAGNDAIQNSNQKLLPALILLVVVSVFAVLICIFLTSTLIRANRSRHGKIKKSFHYLMVGSYLVAAIAIVFTIVCISKYQQTSPTLQNTNPSVFPTGTNSQTDPTGTETSPTEPSDGTVPTDPTIPENKLNITYSPLSDPNNWSVKWDILDNNTIISSYLRSNSSNYFLHPCPFRAAR